MKKNKKLSHHSVKQSFRSKIPLVVGFLIFFVVVSVGIKIGIQSVSASRSLIAITKNPEKSVCGLPGANRARCLAHVITDNSGLPLGTSSPSSSSFGPVQFHTAYNLPCTPGGSTQSNCATPSSFGTQTIAIVDAYYSPTIENDLNVYSSYYNIPSCTKANGCLTLINQNGGSALPTTVDGGWALETSLDVETAHMICQTCKILLVEANSNNYSDLAAAVKTAASLKATSISNSYGGSEWSGESTYDSYYDNPGIAVTVSSGDNGYGAEYPASSSKVVAVGGTTLSLYTDYTYAGESIWSGTGSGCSSVESANSWQTNQPNWNLTGCSTKRGVADISADADPNTGAAVYDSTSYSGVTGWFQVGGTSLASPIVASVYALSGGVPGLTNAASVLYTNYNSINFHDVTTGTNGSCTTTMCVGTTGYDGPTGLGTPNGINGFGGSTTSSPSPSPSPIGDTTPPTVSITSPLDGTLVKRLSTVTISANASDNVGVSRVEFYVNNSLTCTDAITPYSCAWKVPGKRFVSYTLTAKAYDSAGNYSISSVKVQTN